MDIIIGGRVKTEGRARLTDSCRTVSSETGGDAPAAGDDGVSQPSSDKHHLIHRSSYHNILSVNPFLHIHNHSPIPHPLRRGVVYRRLNRLELPRPV